MLILTAAIVAIFCSVAALGFPEVMLSKKVYNLDDSMALFEKFIKAHDKQYKNAEEYLKRHSIFKQNLKTINEQNEEDPHVVYGITDVSDLTYDEFLKYRTGFNSSMVNSYEVKPYVPSDDAPDSMDWRQRNAVTEVKNQGHCGSCYIFSAVGNIEGQHAIKHGQLVSISEQQELDCGRNGCDGGSPLAVMNELAQQGGSERVQDYPYTGHKGSCQLDRSKIVVRVTGGQQLGVQENGLVNAVSALGPISSVVFVNRRFQHYTGGIMRASMCSAGSTPNHAILVVGYGSENGANFWIVKNSWSTKWGEQGYFRIERGSSACQIGSYNFQSTVQ